MWRQVWRILTRLLIAIALIPFTAHGYALGAPAASTNCINPNGKAGVCISIRECGPLHYVLERALSAHYRFVRLSHCATGNDNDDAAAEGKFPYVCCTNDTNFSDAEADYKQRIIFPDWTDALLAPDYRTRSVVLPKPPKCGAITITDKIYGGDEALLTEFSWMVNLEYRTKRDTLVMECAGSIITQLFVLTAAHCVQGPVEEKIGKLVSLRVGVHNVRPLQNCNEIGCLPPYQRIGVAAVKVHERYEADQELRINQHNDIALIRMERAVEFNDYLQPVCLPTAELQKELKPSQHLTAAGWGHTGLATHSNFKQKVRLPLVEQEHCRRLFSKYFYVADDQLCAGGVYNHDTCSGDSGGPLMRVHSTAWVLEGIVSFGRGCGLEDRPGIYTRVRDYMDWIMRNMQMM